MTHRRLFRGALYGHHRSIERAPDNPWPNWPNIFRTSSAHEEGGEREYCVLTKSFTGRDGRVVQLHAVRVEFEGRNMKEVPALKFTLDERPRPSRDGLPRSRA